jgi:hypothetical protein
MHDSHARHQRLRRSSRFILRRSRKITYKTLVAYRYRHRMALDALFAKPTNR